MLFFHQDWLINVQLIFVFFRFCFKYNIIVFGNYQKCVPDMLKQERFSFIRIVFFFLLLKIISFHRNCFLFTRNCILSKEMFPISGNNFCTGFWILKQFSFMKNTFFTGNDFHSEEMFSFQMKWNDFLSQEMTSFRRKLFPPIRNDFLWQIIISFHRQLFPFRWHYFPHRKLFPFKCNISF